LISCEILNRKGEDRKIMNDIPQPTNTKSSYPKSSLYDKLKIIAEFGAGFVVLVYVFGFIIVNTHLLINYGIRTFSIIKYEYVAAGVAFILCAASIATPFFLTLRWIDNLFNPPKTRPQWHHWSLWCQAITVLSISFIPGVLVFHLFFPAEVQYRADYWLWYIYLLVCISLTLSGLQWTYKPESNSPWNRNKIILPTIVACITMYIGCRFISPMALTVFKNYIVFSLSVIFITYLSYYVYHIHKSSARPDIKIWVWWFGLYYIMAFVLLTIFGFGKGLYGHISEVGGGGEAGTTKVVVYITPGKAPEDINTPQDNNTPRWGVLEGTIIERTDKALFLSVPPKDPNDSNVTIIKEIPSENIAEVRYTTKSRKPVIPPK
jgi:hypothetical protein